MKRLLCAGLLLLAAAGADDPPIAGYGTKDMLPVFNEARVARMDFPLARRHHTEEPFDVWRERARGVFLELLGPRPPEAPFNHETLATESRDGYTARKLAFNLSADERVIGYLLTPDGEGPFPAVLALHDHGAHFSIGKEKVIKPFDVDPDVIEDAQGWVDKCYGGRWFGDGLAKRDYVVFATDALFWGGRGRAEGVKYHDQQALGANMFQLGLSWAGKIVWDDLRSVEFMRTLPEVDPDRIGAMGLSMGSHRTWNLCAATDLVKAGAAICWMGDTPTLTSPGNNQTKGYSAFAFIHPGLRNHLDYPDVASIACPKPMLFYNGLQDGLFPVSGVEASYATLRAVWDEQDAGNRLETRLWDVPHEFNETMQEAAFDWIDEQLKD
jgi:dienelactone hydrolase